MEQMTEQFDCSISGVILTKIITFVNSFIFHLNVLFIKRVYGSIDIILGDDDPDSPKGEIARKYLIMVW